MAGHSKWSKVKRFKGAIDAKRGKIFSKLSKEITIAAKTGGGDPNGNPRLRSAIQAARAQSMPNDYIDRALKRGTGEGVEAANFEEIIYEGYGPGGVAIIVEAATDNKNRTAAEVRSIFTKNNGNLGSAGGEELTTEEDQYLIVTSHDRLYAVAEALKRANVTTDGQKFTFIPDSTVPVANEDVARQVLHLCDALEDDDDVQNVYSNLDIPDEMLAKLPA